MATSTAAAHFFYGQIALKHNVSNTVIADQRSHFHFLGKLRQEIFRLFGLRQNTKEAYNPKATGSTERLNGVFNKAISHYTHVNRRNWDNVIPLITFCLNTMRQGTTMYSLFQLVYGRDQNNPLDSAAAFNSSEAIKKTRGVRQIDYKMAKSGPQNFTDKNKSNSR